MEPGNQLFCLVKGNLAFAGGKHKSGVIRPGLVYRLDVLRPA